MGKGDGSRYETPLWGKGGFLLPGPVLNQIQSDLYLRSYSVTEVVS